MPTIQRAAAAQSRTSVSARTDNSPFDLTNGGGPVVTAATSWNVYVNCPSGPAACWGTGSLTPATLLRDLNQSQFLEIADQYLGEVAPGHFQVSELQTTVAFAGNTASVNDILGIVFSASTSANASGYGDIIHVFLPQGTDMCLSPNDCYSPDNPSNFGFCAFHASVDFSPSQHVLFSVEPYQANVFCALKDQTRVIDATAGALTHEFFETITDPDGDAWVSLLTGNEIGDLCFAFRNPERLHIHEYVIQEMYSNSIHGCTDVQRLG